MGQGDWLHWCVNASELLLATQAVFFCFFFRWGDIGGLVRWVTNSADKKSRLTVIPDLTHFTTDHCWVNHPILTNHWFTERQGVWSWGEEAALHRRCKLIACSRVPQQCSPMTPPSSSDFTQWFKNEPDVPKRTDEDGIRTHACTSSLFWHLTLGFSWVLMITNKNM